MRLVVAALVLVLLFAAGAFVVGLGQEVAPDTTAEPDLGVAGLLPEHVAATREALLVAAEEDDHDRLAELAPEDFSYTFGGPVEGGPAAYWRELEAQGERPLEALAAILRVPYALSGGIYVWPFAHAAEPDELTEYELGLLEDIPGGAPVGDEGYLGWRTGIAPDGEWRFFIAGD